MSFLRTLKLKYGVDLRVKLSLVVALLGSTSTTALANCYQTGVNSGSTWTCDTNTPNPYTAGKIGAVEYTNPPGLTVNNGNYNNITTNILAGSTINLGNTSVISLYNNAIINIYGTVQNNSTNATGSYNTGGNTVEVNAGSTIHVYNGGSIIATGSQGSAEAVNFQGTQADSNANGRNTLIIDAGGVVKTTGNALALWNQNGAALTVDNSGILASQNMNANNTVTVLGGNNTAGVNFYNRQGAATYGSIILSGTGPDNIYFYGGSTITGNIDGGAGGAQDNFYLLGTVDQTLTNDIKNFNNLYKQGSNTWTWAANPANDAAHTFSYTEVQQGTLAVTGTLRSNTVVVDNGGTLSGTGTVAAATAFTNNGLLAPGLSNASGALTITGNATNNGTISGYDANSNLNVTGNYTQSSSGNFETHINSMSNYSKIIATGQLSMATGTKITADLNPTLKLNAGDVIPGVIQAATLAAPNAITVDTLSDRYKLLARYTGANVDLYLPANGILNPYNSPGTYYGALQEQTLSTVANIQVPTLGVLHQRYALLNAVTEYDCNKFDKNNFCISAQARAMGFGTQATGAGVLNIAYRPMPQVHVGVFIDYQAAAGNPAANGSPIAVTLNNGGVQYGYDNPTFGGYAGFSQSGYNGNLINSGLQVMVSGAYNPGKVSVTRALIMNPYLPFVDAQPGSGNASLNSSVIRGMVGYGIPLTDHATLMPYGGIRFTDVTRGAYMENYTAIVTQPLAYNSFYERLLTGFGGAMLNGKITDRFGAILGLGVETDFTRYANSLSGYSPIAIEYMTSFSFDHGGTWNGLRPTANAGAYYDIAPNQRISLNGYAGQQAWTSRTYATGLLGYQIAF